MRRAAFRVFHGHPYTDIVMHEYMTRKRLAKLGIQSQTNEFSSWKIDQFMEIDRELDRLAEQKRQRDARK